MLNILVIVLATLVAVGIAARWYGAYQWTGRTHGLRAALDAARVPVRPLVVNFRELDGLPAPVQRFFRAVLKEGQPFVAGVRLQHTGRFNMGENADQWRAFTSEFTFHDDGPIDTVHADARARMVGGTLVPTPWQGRFWNYQERGGMRVPLDGEVAWLLPEGPKPYWRGHITDITFEFAR